MAWHSDEIDFQCEKTKAGVILIGWQFVVRYSVRELAAVSLVARVALTM